MQKLYCYVDESGQDTEGDLFIVSVVVSGRDKEKLNKLLEEVEHSSRKGRRKWVQTRDKQNITYIRHVLKTPSLKDKINYAVYRQTTEYLPRTILTVARAITKHVEKEYRATIFVDGLPRSQTRWFGAELRHLRIRTEKVRGVRKESADALMRLADAIAGFARDAVSGDRKLMRLLEKAKSDGSIKEL